MCWLMIACNNNSSWPSADDTLKTGREGEILLAEGLFCMPTTSFMLIKHRTQVDLNQYQAGACGRTFLYTEWVCSAFMNRRHSLPSACTLPSLFGLLGQKELRRNSLWQNVRNAIRHPPRCTIKQRKRPKVSSDAYYLISYL